VIEVLLLLAQALVAFALCMAAFRARYTFGMAPLFFTLGALECMKYFAVAQMVVDVPHLGYIFPGSVVFYVGSLAVVLVVYAREGLTPTRQLMWALLYVSLAVSLLSVSFYQLLKLPNTKQLMPYDPRLFSISAWWEFIGTLLLLAGVLASIVIYSALRRFRLSFAVRGGITLALVVAADSVLFDIATRGFAALSSPTFVPNMMAKIGMAIVYALLGHLYLRYLESQAPADNSHLHPVGREVVAALTYQRQIADLERELQRDPLTGVFNRRYLQHILPEQVDLDMLRGESTSLLLFDLDRFKAINDQYGHLAGDQALKHMTQVISGLVRRSDSLVRLGGEEFVVLLPSVSTDEARIMAEHMLEVLAASPMSNGGETITLTATIGIASAPADGITLRQLLRIADERMYRGKRSGRNRVVAGDA
jgi:diguanylate cyclase (GGDEF)-like protein